MKRTKDITILIIILIWGGCKPLNLIPSIPVDKEYSLSTSQIQSINGSLTKTPMQVYDRFGKGYYLQDISIPQNSEIAGIFRLHFWDNDNLTGQGFDDPTLGPAARATIIQVFEDLSILLGGVPSSPYPGQTNPCPNPFSAPFPTCRFIEIDIKQSTVGMPSNALGAASQYYGPFATLGIDEGNVSKYIKSGYDPYYNLSNFPNGFNGFFHGYMQFNFNYDFFFNLNSTSIPSNEYDLYTIALHETIHALGFASLINQTGGSKLTLSSPGIYSLYDTYLVDGSGNSLIDFDIDNDCYDAEFNSSIVNPASLIGPCNTVDMHFIGPGNIPNNKVFTQSPFYAGSSYSHFNCSPTPGYAMNAASPLAYVNRTPNLAEVQALCALGYDVQSTYGGAFPASTASYSNACPSTVNRSIAGVNDFRTYSANNLGTDFQVQAGSPLNFTSTDFLQNDFNAQTMSCLKVVYGGSTSNLTNIALTNFTYTPPLGFSGVAILAYRPVNSLGQRGNITYIFINVLPVALPCIPSGCNLVCNGDFSNFVTGLEMSAFWMVNSNMNSPTLCLNSGNNYIGLASHSSTNRESVELPLNRPIKTGCTVTINFLAARNAHTNNTSGTLKFNMLGSENPACLFTTGLTISNSCAGAIGSCSSFNSICMVDIPITNLSPYPAGYCPLPNPNFQSYTTTFTNTGSDINFIIIATGTNSAPGFLLVDDVEIISDCEIPLNITSIVNPLGACPGENVTIDYTVCLGSGATSNPQDIDLAATPLSTDLQLFPGGNFINGAVTIPAGTLSGGSPCTNLTLNLQINNNAAFGVPLANELNLISGGCQPLTGSIIDNIVPGVGGNGIHPIHEPGTGREEATSVVEDGNGNLYVTGFFSNGITFGNQTFTSGSTKNMFIAKYFSGCLEWVKTFGVNGSVNPEDMQMDNTGNLFITGDFSGNVNFGSFILSTSAIANSEMFILKMDDAGNVLQAKQSIATGGASILIASGKKISIDPTSNDIAVVGTYKGIIIFGGLGSISSNGLANSFVIKYNNSLLEMWVNSIGSTYTTQGEQAGGIGIDGSGNVYVALNVLDNITFNGNNYPHPHMGTYDIFLAKFSSAGAGITGGMSNSSTLAKVQDLVVDATGNIYFTGILTGTLAGISAANNEILVAKYNSSLGLLWGHPAGGATYFDFGQSITLNNNDLIISGQFKQTATFPTFAPITSIGGSDLFVWKMNTSGVGSFLSQAGGGNPSNQILSRSIHCNASGDCFVAGSFNHTAPGLSFGGLPNIIAQSSSDFYVCRINNSGAFY